MLKHKKKQDDQRKHLQSFVDRFRAKATKAAQAQSRLKMLAKMEPIAAIVDGHILPVPPALAGQDACRRRSSPWRTRASAMTSAPVLKRLSLRHREDDRIGLLGSNGNGKSTFAKLVAGRLQAQGGAVRRSSKLEVGFFAQHQVDDLDEKATPYQCVAELMRDATEAKIRAQMRAIRLSEHQGRHQCRAIVGRRKGAAPHGARQLQRAASLILDEPTNHLDIDSRAALIEAINDFEGAIILVSHDRHLLEACADRLWLVADGTVAAFDGDVDDYKKYVLDRAGAGNGGGGRKDRAAARAEAPQRGAASVRQDAGPLKKRIWAVEEKMRKFQDLVARVDKALANPAAFTKIRRRRRNSRPSAATWSRR